MVAKMKILVASVPRSGGTWLFNATRLILGTTGEDDSVLLRLKEDYDGAEPSAASVTVRNLIQLAQLTGNGTLLDRARVTLERYGPGLGQVVRVMPLMASNLALWYGPRAEVVIAGAPGAADTVALEAVAGARYLPWTLTIPAASGRPDPVEDFKVINTELASFGNGLDEKPMIVIATKIDAANPEKLKKLQAHAKRRKLEFHAISAVTGAGIDELKWALANRLRPVEATA